MFPSSMFTGKIGGRFNTCKNIYMNIYFSTLRQYYLLLCLMCWVVCMCVVMRVLSYPISEDLLRNVHVDVLGLDLYAAADGGGVGDGADGALQPRLGQVVRLGLPEPDGAHGDRGDAAVDVTIPSVQTGGSFVNKVMN